VRGVLSFCPTRDTHGVAGAQLDRSDRVDRGDIPNGIRIADWVGKGSPTKNAQSSSSDFIVRGSRLGV
jgi:hypothetical protein